MVKSLKAAKIFGVGIVLMLGLGLAMSYLPYSHSAPDSANQEHYSAAIPSVVCQPSERQPGMECVVSQTFTPSEFRRWVGRCGRAYGQRNRVG